MNQLKVRSTIGEYDKLTLSPKGIAELSKQFKNTRIARKHNQTRVGRLYNVSFQIISDWEHSLRVTPYAEACMRDYIEYDLSALINFIDKFQTMHFMLAELLPCFYLKCDDRLDRRDEFMDKIQDLKMAYYSLKDFDKINISDGMLFFLDLDGNRDLILVLYHGVMRFCRNFIQAYYLAFIKTQKLINELLSLYGIKKQLELLKS